MNCALRSKISDRGPLPELGASLVGLPSGVETR